MKRNSWIFIATMSLMLASASHAADIGTAFTYQGSLENGSGPVTDTCDFRFGLWDAAAGGNQMGASPQTVVGVAVESGVFTTPVDFGASAIDGTARWLEIEVKCPPDTGFTPLLPRVELQPAPHALALPGLYTLKNAISPNLIGGYSGNVVGDGAVGATINGGGTSTSPNHVVDNFGSIGGGVNNQAGSFDGDPTNSQFATVSGGLTNIALEAGATVAGGAFNNALGIDSVVSGGESNLAESRYTTIAGGKNNEATAQFATIGGGGASSGTSGPWICNGGPSEGSDCGRCVIGFAPCSVNSSCTPPFCVRNDTVCPGYCGPLIGGNRVTDDYGTIGGGSVNRAGDDDATPTDSPHATVAGGTANIAGAQNATVGGGNGNIASGTTSAIGGGGNNDATASYSTVGGGNSNTASGQHSTIGGGDQNAASSVASTVGGGSGNLAAGVFSTVPGGSGNVAGGHYSFAAGRNVRIRDPAIVGGGDTDGDEGTFTWADSTGGIFASTGPNQFLIRAAGGTRIYSDSTATVGVQVAAGGNSWSAISDRNVKENFKPLDGMEVLRRLSSVPITEWNLISQDCGIRHVGPMAQDFHAAFGLGEDERYISSSDADGVALAAIQGLFGIVQEKDCRIEELEARLARIEALLADTSTKGEKP